MAATVVQTKARVKELMELTEIEIKTKSVEQSMLPLIQQVNIVL